MKDSSGSASGYPPETVRGEGEGNGPSAPLPAEASGLTLAQAVEEAITLIAKSEETGWCIYATDARELLTKALDAQKKAPMPAGNA